MKKTLLFLKKPIGIAAAVFILLAGAIAYASFKGDGAPKYETASAVRKDVVQEVSVTGKIVPAESVDLAFERGGKVATAGVAIGVKVAAGQVLASLASGDIAADLSQARAAVHAEEARLAELMRGARPEELAVHKAKVASAETAVADAKRGLADKLGDAYTRSDDAVRAKTTGIFSGYKASGYTLTYISCDGASEASATQLRLRSEGELDLWSAARDAATPDASAEALVTAARDAKARIAIFTSLFQSIAATFATGCNSNATALDTYRANVASARASLDTAVLGLSSAEEKLRSAEAALTLQKQELLLKQAGTVEEQIAAQRAQVERAKAVVQSHEAQFAKTVIRSPIAGVVTAKNVKAGEIVAAGSPVISIISLAQFEVETNIPEADIAKVHVGDPAEVTLDAYGRDVIFHAKAVAVEPAETVVDGVSTYKSTFHFVESDPRIRSGMTANITIKSGSRENVIAIPQRAVIRKDGERMVRILEGSEVADVAVETGLRGSDGDIEIVSGINEGDAVIIFGGEEQ